MTRTRSKRSDYRKGTRPRRDVQEIGYQPCGCPGCFEIAIGKPGEMCLACEEAGCDGRTQTCKVEPEGEV